MLINYAPAFFGGLIIGLAAVLLMLINGRIAGVSGILQGVLWQKQSRERFWRLTFILGIPIGSGIMSASSIVTSQLRSDFPWWALALSGLLVGFGTALGNGCTSGHGVCGIGRLSHRSILATLTFIVSAAVTVFIIRHLLGGLS